MYRLIACFFCLVMALPASALSVIFINPGKSEEVYWQTASRAMQAAAHDLEIKLSVYYAERDYGQNISIAKRIVALPETQRPDYVILTNEYTIAPALLDLLNGAGIKTFMAFSGRDEKSDRFGMGGPRQRYRFWIGSLEPDAEAAGYLTARSLIAKGRKAKLPRINGKLPLLAIGGAGSTPTSINRSAGMLRAVAEAGDVTLLQEVYADWNQQRAEEQSTTLFRRYPQARLVWAGNDLMAFGAMDAWQKKGGKPGQDAFFSGINTSAKAMAALQDGTLEALAGGHFMAGAWSLVMIYDYHKGMDFRSEGVALTRPMFHLFNPASATRYMQRYGGMDFDTIDFRHYSKVLNPKLSRYNFDFKQLL